MAKSVNKETLLPKDQINVLVNKTGLTVKDATTFYDAFVEMIEEQTADYNVKLKDLGFFEKVLVNETTRKNPKTGEEVVVAEHHEMKLRRSKKMKEIYK